MYIFLTIHDDDSSLHYISTFSQPYIEAARFESFLQLHVNAQFSFKRFLRKRELHLKKFLLSYYQYKTILLTFDFEYRESIVSDALELHSFASLHFQNIFRPKTARASRRELVLSTSTFLSFVLHVQQQRNFLSYRCVPNHFHAHGSGKF